MGKLGGQEKGRAAARKNTVGHGLRPIRFHKGANQVRTVTAVSGVCSRSALHTESLELPERGEGTLHGTGLAAVGLGASFPKNW